MTDVVRRPPARAGCSQWRPLDSDLAPEVRCWVRQLRTLWDAIGMTINRFALANNVDKGTVSRYLNGKRVPGDHWFLNRLLAIQAERGKEVAKEVRDHLTTLQMEALQAAHPHEYRVQMVRDELQVAIIGQQEAERYAAHLQEQITDRHRRVGELTDELGRLRTAWDDDRAAMQAEKERLQAEIADLARQLDHTRRRAADAEERCGSLERLLERMETQALPTPADSFQPGAFSDPRMIARVIEGMARIGDQQVTRLSAEVAAAECPLTDLAGIANLLKVLAEQGFEEERDRLAARAVAECPVTGPEAASLLLAALDEVYVEQARMIYGISGADVHSGEPLHCPTRLPDIEEGLRKARAFADRAATECPVAAGDVSPLLRAIHALGAVEAQQKLARRAVDSCFVEEVDPKTTVTLLSTLYDIGARQEA